MVSSSFSFSAGSLFMLWLASPAAAKPNYQLVENWHGKSFLDYFNFHTGSDPTNGFVTYLDQGSAQDAGLVKLTDGGSVYIGVDHNTTLSSSGKGRDSVRIGSKKYYDQSLVIADIAHMPGSICGTWPAFWSVGKEWPGDGEIDIIEGVNLQDHNEIVMHTAGTCSLTDQGMTGAVNATGCGEDLGTVGCVIEGDKGSYGTSFNKQGGGVYAMEWTEEYLKIWFFPRHSIPSSISKGNPDVTEFGSPMALVQEGCDVANSFKSQSFVFDVTFCGDWAGGVFGESGCPMSSSDPLQSCIDYVAQHPAHFEQTYWEINSVKIYQTGVKESAAPSATHTTASEVSVAHASATQAPETSVAAETSATHATASEVSVTHDTATRVVTETAALVETPASEGWHTVGFAAASSEGTAPAGIVAPLGGESTASGAATAPPAGSFPTTSESSSTSASGTGAPAGAFPTTTDAKPATTRYVTKLVTSTKTLCSLSANWPTPAANVPEKPATAESAKSEVPVASHSANAAEAPIEQQSIGPDKVLTAPVVIQPTQVANSDVAHAVASADAVSNNRDESAAQALPTVIPGPGYNPGSASLLPSVHASQTSKPVIPAPTGSKAASGTAFAGSSSTGTSPVFTGAAVRLSVKFWMTAVAFVFAMVA